MGSNFFLIEPSSLKRKLSSRASQNTAPGYCCAYQSVLDTYHAKGFKNGQHRKIIVAPLQGSGAVMICRPDIRPAEMGC